MVPCCDMVVGNVIVCESTRCLARQCESDQDQSCDRVCQDNRVDIQILFFEIKVLKWLSIIVDSDKCRYYVLSVVLIK